MIASWSISNGDAAGLIEAYWNVNAIFYQQSNGRGEGLIEAYWNVNKEFCVYSVNSMPV